MLIGVRPCYSARVNRSARRCMALSKKWPVDTYTCPPNACGTCLEGVEPSLLLPMCLTLGSRHPYLMIYHVHSIPVDGLPHIMRTTSMNIRKEVADYWLHLLPETPLLLLPPRRLLPQLVDVRLELVEHRCCSTAAFRVQSKGASSSSKKCLEPPVVVNSVLCRQVKRSRGRKSRKS
jgi:hypothetical protein